MKKHLSIEKTNLFKFIIPGIGYFLLGLLELTSYYNTVVSIVKLVVFTILSFVEIKQLITPKEDDDEYTWKQQLTASNYAYSMLWIILSVVLLIGFFVNLGSISTIAAIDFFLGIVLLLRGFYFWLLIKDDRDDAESEED